VIVEWTRTCLNASRKNSTCPTSTCLSVHSDSRGNQLFNQLLVVLLLFFIWDPSSRLYARSSTAISNTSFTLQFYLRRSGTSDATTSQCECACDTKVENGFRFIDSLRDRDDVIDSLAVFFVRHIITVFQNVFKF